MEEKLTVLQAYKVMITFLKEYYWRFGQDNVADILSAIQLIEDEKSADPAAWFDWLEAVKKTLEENK